MPQLSTSFSIDWQDWRGRDCEADVEVDYTYDGDVARIVKITGDGIDEIDDYLLEGIVYERLEDIAPEDYAEWAADQADYLPTASESTVPGLAA